MNLAMSTSQADELQHLLESVLSEMSHEIAATDNAGFRAKLMARRTLLADLEHELRDLLAAAPERAGEEAPDALVRELARPGD